MVLVLSCDLSKGPQFVAGLVGIEDNEPVRATLEPRERSPVDVDGWEPVGVVPETAG